MKLQGEIIATENCGDTVKLILQAKVVDAPDWRSVLSFSIELPAYKAVERSYHLGRIIAIEVAPK